MRFEELVLRIPGDEFKIRFHEQLSVLSGIGLLERQALADGIIGAVTGTSDGTVLVYRDCEGRPVQLVAYGDRVTGVYLDDNSPSPPLVGSIAPDASAVRELMLVQAADLGLVPTRPRSEDSPELSEARTMLGTLTQELQDALAGRQHIDQARQDLAVVEAELRAAEDGNAQREYARVLADLERVRAEAAAVQTGAAGIENDRHLLASANGARMLAARWGEATKKTRSIAVGFGEVSRLSPENIALARFIPDEPPSQLAPMLVSWSDARRSRDELDTRLRQLAAQRLPDPSDPRVVDLATLNQRELWSARQRVIEAVGTQEREQLALGGLSSDGIAPAVVEGIEQAHTAVEEQEEIIRRRLVPTVASSGIGAALSLMLATTFPIVAAVLLVAAAGLAAGALGLPHRRLTIARFHEQSVLAGTGASTYLAFHLRRVDAAIDPKARLRLDTAAAERREALREWNEIAHGVDVATAGALEAEVRTYSTALGGMGGAADEIENLHAELIQRAEPAVAVARGRLAEALEAYAVDPGEVDAALDGDDPDAIEVMFGRQVALGRAARMQDSLQDAEAEDQKLGAQLDDTLHQLGFREGNIEARVGALEWAIRRATEREEARANARPRGAIEADLDRLTAEATRLRRPEWASVTANDAGPDVESLERRRDVLRALIASTPASSLDIDRLSDRHSALERRVAALESKVGSTHSESTVAQLADVHQYLLAHLTRAAHAGPRDESVPVILDEPFLRVPAERKWELLDMLRRLGEKTQLIYLTDDPFVTAWARRRAAAGLITLLEPISDVA